MCTKNAFSECKLPVGGEILDIPCGTGIMATIINKFDIHAVASDISMDMIKLARNAYAQSRLMGIMQSDIIQMPFRENAFDCVLVIALMHRLPGDIRMRVYEEVAAVTKKYVIVSYTIDSALQRLKQWSIKRVNRLHQSAPLPLTFKAIEKEINENGLKIAKKFSLMPFFSSSVVFLLEKK